MELIDSLLVELIELKVHFLSMGAVRLMLLLFLLHFAFGSASLGRRLVSMGWGL